MTVLSSASPAIGKALDREVSFQVQNVNRSMFACQSDGGAYEIEGHYVAPRRVPTTRRGAVTLLVHGAEITGDYMRFDAVRGYDFQAALARKGHATVVVNRLGYGAGSRPRGDQVCYGSQADVIHQVVGALRSGSYETADGASPSFNQVALAAHSVGTPIAEIEAASFDDVDALIAMSWGAPDALEIVPDLATSEVPSCPLGGADAPGPRGYAYQWPDAKSYEMDVFYDVAPNVLAAAAGLRRRSPCGDVLSNVPMALQEPSIVAEIDVPVLVMIGDHDALFPPPAGPRQLSLFESSKDKRLITVAETGHTLFLERSAPVVQRAASRWLARRGF